MWDRLVSKEALEKHYNALAKSYEYENWPKAAAYYGKALMVAPAPDSNLYENLGYSYIHAKNYDSAFAVISRGLNKFPRDEYLYNNMGITYYMLDQYDSAIAYYKKAIGVDSTIANIWANLANNYCYTRDFNAADAAIKKALSLNAEAPWVHEVEGDMYLESGRYDLAVEKYKKVYELDTAQIDVLAYGYFETGKYDSAKSIYLKLVKEDTTSASDWASLGLILTNMKNYDSALICFNRAIKLKPYDHFIWTNMARYYIRTKNYRDAIYCANKAISLARINSDAYAYKGFAYLLKGNTRDGLSCLDTAIDMNKYSFLPYSYLACHFARSDKKKSYDYLKTSILKGLKKLDWLYDLDCYEYMKKDKDINALLQSIEKK